MAPHLLYVTVARRVLILEDSVPLIRQLGRLLTTHGYEVCQTSSVAAFLATAATEQFDACLLDLWLPDGNGLDAWATARAEHGQPAAILMTAHCTPEVERRAEALAVSALFPKPLDVPALLAALEAVAGAPRPRVADDGGDA